MAPTSCSEPWRDWRSRRILEVAARISNALMHPLRLLARRSVRSSLRAPPFDRQIRCKPPHEKKACAHGRYHRHAKQDGPSNRGSRDNPEVNAGAEAPDYIETQTGASERLGQFQTAQ